MPQYSILTRWKSPVHWYASSRLLLLIHAGVLRFMETQLKHYHQVAAAIKTYETMSGIIMHLGHSRSFSECHSSLMLRLLCHQSAGKSGLGAL
jgi:fructose/tagatose bisphosphate aldolase